jgi:hypothetical protein
MFKNISLLHKDLSSFLHKTNDDYDDDDDDYDYDDEQQHQ